MPESYPKELEIQRLTNLSTGFGWEMTKEEVIGQDLVVTLKKRILSEKQTESAPVPS